MRILHLANTPLSNAPENLASCQRHMGYDSRLLLAHKTGRNKIFVGGSLWSDLSYEELEDIFTKADIIHFHNFTWTQEIFVKHLPLKAIAKSKKCVVQFHSDRRAHEDFEDNLRDPFFNGKRLVIAQYQVRQYPECEWVVPNPLPLHEDKFRLLRRGKWGDVPPLCISYAPSNMHLTGWDYKGYDKIKPYLNRIPNISTDIITNSPYEECLTRKSYAHVGIEEIFTGSYHLSLLEYMALECVALGNMDDLTSKALTSAIGEEAFKTMPYQQVDCLEDVGVVIESFKRDPALAKEIAGESRRWMEKYWSPESLMPIYNNIYESI